MPGEAEMPREIARKPRFIYPTIATSLSIAKISALAELLLWRLLPQADDQGRLTGHPKQLKAVVCPMREEITEEHIPELLEELQDADLIIRYSTSEPLIQIKAWWNYQAGMRRIYPSRYPAPEGWKDRVIGVSDGQTPTNAPIVSPISEEVNISGNQVISKSLISKSVEAVVTPPTTATEKELIKLLSALKGWQADEDDVLWHQGLRSEFPGLTLAELKACIDYYSGKAPPKHKGIWKNRFRNWMIKRQEFGKRAGDAGQGGYYGTGYKPPKPEGASKTGRTINAEGEAGTTN